MVVKTKSPMKTGSVVREVKGMKKDRVVARQGQGLCNGEMFVEGVGLAIDLPLLARRNRLDYWSWLACKGDGASDNLPDADSPF